MFEHAVFRFGVKCPIFVARQWMRHRICSFNEKSLRYCVADVKVNKYGGSFIKLTSTPPARNPPAEPLTPREALAEASKSICEPLGEFLSDPTVCVPDAARLVKGEVVVSGAWLVPVSLDAWGGVGRGGACYRSGDELLDLMGFGR